MHIKLQVGLKMFSRLTIEDLIELSWGGVDHKIWCNTDLKRNQI